MSRYIDRTGLAPIYRVRLADARERRLHPTHVLDFGVAIGTGILAALGLYALWLLA